MKSRKGLLVMVAVALVACRGSDSNPIGPVRTGFGTLALVRVNGQGFPALVGDKHWTYGGYLRLDSIGTYTRDWADSAKNAQGGTDRFESQDHGTWTSAGDSIFLTSTLTAVAIPRALGIFTPVGATVNVGSAIFEYSRSAPIVGSNYNRDP